MLVLPVVSTSNYFNLFKINNKPEIYFNENGLVVNVYGDKLLDYTSK